MAAEKLSLIFSQRSRRVPALLLALCLLASCRSVGDSQEKGVEGAEHQSVVLMGSELSGGLLRPAKIVIDYQEGLRTADHLLRVRMNIRNRSTSQTQVQVQTIFKDEDWTPVGEKVDWKLMRLKPGETQRYEAISETSKPTRYTVRIRPFG